MNKTDFLAAFDGHSNAYARFKVIDVKLDDLVTALNKLRPNGCFGSGQISDRGIYFEGCKESPDGLLSELTAELHCKGFADIDAWYGSPYFVAYKNGTEYNDYTASWGYGSPSPYMMYMPVVPDGNEDMCDEWAAFVIVKDNESSEIFYTGAGCVDTETKELFADIVKNHKEVAA